MGLSAKEKGLAALGLTGGGFPGLLIPAVQFTVMFLEMSTGAWRDRLRA
jgi:hypothetical protein